MEQKRSYNMFNRTLQYLLERDAKMTLGGYAVTDVDTEKATVQGTVVLRGEVESLLNAMDKAEFPFDIRDVGLNEGGTFVNFTVTTQRAGWLAPESKGFYPTHATFCLRRAYAVKLRDYLDAQLAKSPLVP